MKSQNEERAASAVSPNAELRLRGDASDRYGRTFQVGTHRLRTVIRSRQVLFVYADFIRAAYKKFSGITSRLARLTPAQKDFSHLAIVDGIGSQGGANVLTEGGLCRAALGLHKNEALKAAVVNEMVPYARDIAKGVRESMAGLDWPFRSDAPTEIPAFLPKQIAVPALKIEIAEPAPAVPAADRDPTLCPIVRERDGKLWVDSRDVAAAFGKQHKDVLRDIRNLHCTEDFRGRNFAPFKIKDLTGETTSHVEMTKDGFTFLAMGFTGAKAAAFKEAYIGEFNRMEETLRSRPAADPVAMLNDPAALRGILGHYVDRVIALQGMVSELEPKAAVVDRIASTAGSLSMSDAAKSLGLRPALFPTWLASIRWIFRRNGQQWVAYQGKIDERMLEHRIVRLQRSTGPDKVVSQVRVTAAGMVALGLIAGSAK